MPGNQILASVVPHTIVEHKLHVINKLLNSLIHVEGEFFLDCPEIHGLVDDIEIIIDSVLARVHRLMEEVPAL